VKEHGPQPTQITRRNMLEKLLAAMAAGAVWPALASALDWKPVLLNSQQNETLVALSESIVPGSANAQVNRFIDLLLSVDTTQNQEKFIASLTDVERTTEAKFGRPFHQLTANEKDDLLVNFSSDKTHQKSFDDLKEWIALAYYSSQDGMRELGWTDQHAFRQYPVCP
jgi:Gluconate 2-dehydrogenase subunit 3